MKKQHVLKAGLLQTAKVSLIVLPMRTSFYQYSYNALESLCLSHGLTPASPSILYNWYFKQNKREFCSHHNLPQKTRKFLTEMLDFSLPTIGLVKESADKTVKFLLRLTDGLEVETVLIPFQNKYTICLSSQVGCAMNCAFCFTGTQGLSRHLKVEEIVGQFLQAQQWLNQNRPNDNRILNIVYMGQGEPLHNFDAVKTSAEIFLSQHGLSLAPHKITISTSGYIPGLRRWKEEMPNVNIALSLHSPYTEKRNKLIPINRKYPLEDVIALVDAIPEGKNRFVTYEYLLIKDFNDSVEDANTTGALLKGRKAYINLIPFNPYPSSSFERSSEEMVLQFKKILDTYGIPTLIRTTKGDEILAACGQLNTNSNIKKQNRNKSKQNAECRFG